MYGLALGTFGLVLAASAVTFGYWMQQTWEKDGGWAPSYSRPSGPGSWINRGLTYFCRVASPHSALFLLLVARVRDR